VGDIAALPIAVPLLVGGLLVATHWFTPRWLGEWVSLVTAIAATALCALLVAGSDHEPIVEWLGGWQPRHGVALGVSLTIDPLGAGMATLAGVLVSGALLFSWRYFETAAGLFHPLMLVFLAAMVGFCLSGDLFNMFVFFELMGVAAYALTGYRVEEAGPLQGAINFAVTNSTAGFAILIGIGLVYGRTGALNLAQVGAALSGQPPDALVVVGMALIVLGFLTKAAAVPFHFWLADAHAVAPTPVCVLFSGAMVELGVFGAARVLSTAFGESLAPVAGDLRAVLVGLGVTTALVGGAMCFAQRHLKRLLAFSTLSHMGILVAGIGFLGGKALGGVATYALGHGLAKGALFMCVGVLLHRFGDVDEYDLRGRGRALPVVGAVFATGGLLLASVPFGTTFYGKSLLTSSALEQGFPWLPGVIVVASALTGGAVLRAAGRVFGGWGPERPTEEDEESRAQARAARHDETFETTGPHERTPALMVLPAVLLMLGAVAFGLVPGLVPFLERAAGHFRDESAYLTAVLLGHAPHYLPTRESHVKAFDFLYAGGATLGAVGLASIVLFGRDLLERVPRGLRGPSSRGLHEVRALHSGHIGDYIAWLTAGVTVLCGTFLLLMT
jgi:multicomponent Na+:H+ antiporter subunit D